uniref:Acyl-[acyl-carrier-protein] hydrolase n=1 Tax=Lactuca sativa TaxID=4236 RepID=A0A9R1V568_LACSA|nr:hypothetical protein LSAT_V11C700382230 [Lactuca sativa]
MLLAAISTIFLATEKQWMMLDWKTKRPDMLSDLDPFGLGRMVEDGFETTLNHVKHVGLLGDGFGSTPEMGDMVQVDTWVAASGKNGMQRDWMIRDYKTGEILTRASRLEL